MSTGWVDFQFQGSCPSLKELPTEFLIPDSHVNILISLQKELGKQTDCPYMCAYKLVTVKFKWWGLQNKVENFIQKVGEPGTDVGWQGK